MLKKEELIRLMRTSGFAQYGSVSEIDYSYDHVGFEYDRIIGKGDEKAWDKFIRLAFEQLKG